MNTVDHVTLLCVKHDAQNSGLKVNDQLVTYATRFLTVRLKKYVWFYHHALKAKV